MIPSIYYLGNPPLTFSNTIGPITYPFPNMVSTKIVAIGGIQGVQVSVMTPLVIAPICDFSTENRVPYFQPPTQNPPSRFNNFSGGIPTGGNGSCLHGSERPLGGGEQTLGKRWWTSKQRRTPKWWRTSKRWWRRISGWRRCKCAFRCSLVRFPLEPMVSTTGTHYPYGSFIKENIVIPNLLSQDKFGCSCLSVLKSNSC